MKSYGMRGEMNPQTKQKQDMTPSNHYKGKSNKKAVKGHHDMSPKVKEVKGEPIWQNMRG